jgi:ubiquinone/menaquinone biosynthesis C-methylase UbiE
VKGVYDQRAWAREPSGFIPPEGEFAFPDKAAKHLLHWFALRGGRSVLDVGCCDGRYRLWMGHREADFGYVGLDITLPFLRRAKSELPEPFIQGSVMELPFKDKSFDLVMCPNVLMHLPELKRPVSELCRVSRGYVIISLYGSDRELGHLETHDQNFLNHWYTWDEIDEVIPREFYSEREWCTNPEWDMGVMIYQKLLARK